MSQNPQQAAASDALMKAFDAYARDIGCTVEGGTIKSHSREQSEKLMVKWQELTGART